MGDSYISRDAVIGLNNQFGQGVIIKEGVKIGDNNIIGHNIVIEGKVEIGSNNYIDNFVTIGGLPQHSRTKYEFQPDLVTGNITIGNGNVIREFVTINLPTSAYTTIEDNCYIMSHSHIGHDVVLESGVIMASACNIGGHCKVLKGANLGKAVLVHPRTIIGQISMVGMGTIVVKNICPGATVVGNPAAFLHTNKVGLERNKYIQKEINEIDDFLNLRITSSEVKSFSPNVQKIIDHFFALVQKARNTDSVPSCNILTTAESKS